MSKVGITETVLRDAHQCLLATRLRTEDMLPICDKLDKVGYWALEIWGGATFDSCIRFLKEDPWERLRALRKALPNTRLSMLLRGQNLVGYRHYADDVVRAFVDKTCDNGIDVFRIFDALNDIRNMRVSIEQVKQNKKHAQGAIAYTVSPVHTIEKFVTLAKQFEDLGCDSLAIKDMAGLLTPVRTRELYESLNAQISIPIHNHSHATAGVANLCHMEAIKAGCQVVDTAISSFSEGASHPCTESMVIALENTEYDTKLDLALLEEIAAYFATVRKKYHQYESESTGIDPRVHLYQVPGGMISNLYNQLKEQNALDKWQDVQQEIPRVRKELGYPPLVTPSSQVVGTQAVMNVITGERYKSITNEVKLYCQGKYGKPPGKIDKTVQRKAIGDAKIVEERPADLIPDELEAHRKKIGSLAKTEEDVLSYALFPDIAKEYFEQREAGTLKPEILDPVRTETYNSPHNFKVSLHGESYEVTLTGTGQKQKQKRPFYLTVDGMPEEVLVEVIDELGESAQSSVNDSSRPRPSKPGDVAVSMPSTIIDVHVKEGDEVSAGTPLLVAEAMKMQTEIQAPIAGTIKKTYVKNGDMVTPDEVLVEIEA